MLNRPDGTQIPGPIGGQTLFSNFFSDLFRGLFWTGEADFPKRRGIDVHRADEEPRAGNLVGRGLSRRPPSPITSTGVLGLDAIVMGLDGWA
jgi:hypothetical protein